MSDPTVKGRWESFLPDLPDGIVINILSRLQTKDLLRCRCVVKKWRDLTSTPYFVDLHKQRGLAHMILVDVPERKGGQRDQFFLDEWWITARKKPPFQKIYAHPSYHTDFSHGGLLVMSSQCICCQEIVIVNPIFREKLKIVISEEWHSWINKVYGVYFNPSLKEYCAIFEVTLHSSTMKPPITYKMLTLGPKPCLRDIRNPYKDRCLSSDFEIKQPAMVDGFLYWLIDAEEKYTYYADIMEFDTRSDEFKLMRCPAPMTDYGEFGLDLLNVDGFLSLVQIFAHRGVVAVKIWSLKDRASESWTCSHYDVDYKVYPPKSGWMHFETIAVRCGEIVIRSEQKLYVCNLECGTAKVLGNMIYKEDSKFFSHDICLSSLKNCKPVIHIGNRKKCRDCDRLDKKETSSSNSAVNEYSDVVEEIAVSALDEVVGSSTYVDGEPNVKGRWESFLPDEVVINILSRLQPKDVLRCRCVVKRWRDLTSTSHFMDLHKLHGVVQTILVDLPKRKRRDRDQFFLDEWWITAGKRPPIQKIYGQPLYCSDFSHDGLLGMSSSCICSHKIVIVNPIFCEKVKIVISKEWHSWISKVYGVYFNPTLKEYCALFQVTLDSSIGQPVPLDSSTMKPPITYKILTLGPKPCLRDIRNPYEDRYLDLDLHFKHPAMVDGYLYWFIDLEDGNEYSYYADIMEFDTRSDEFKLMRYPRQMTDYGRFSLDLLNIDGFLTLVQLAEHRGAVVVNMLTMKDRASELWTSSQYYVNRKVYPEGSWGQLETIAVRCGEMLIWSEQRLYVCNLKWGTTKVLGNTIYKGFLKFLSHDICLSSLKNCKPVIRIGNRKKCWDCDRLDKKEASSSNSAVYEHSDVVEEITISALESSM